MRIAFRYQNKLGTTRFSDMAKNFEPDTEGRAHQFDAAKGKAGQSAREFIPEQLGFARVVGDAQSLAPPVQIDRNRHYGRDADDPPGAPDLDIGGV